MIGLRGRRSYDERGSTMVMWALLLVALLIMVALAVDLGNVGAQRRRAQTVADLAAAAAGAPLSEINPDTGAMLDSAAIDACETAFDYVKKNAPDFPQAISADCTPLGLTSACDANLPPNDATFSGPTDPYTITIRYPVPDSDIADSNINLAGGVDPAHDGSPCERLEVDVASRHKSYFAGVIGVGSLTTHRMAVVLREPPSPASVPALWLLDPFGCAPSLKTGGNASVIVGTTATPGQIVVDSDGTGAGCGGGYTITAGGSDALIKAEPTTSGTISLFAYPAGATSCVQPACNQAGDVNPGYIQPAPRKAAQRATRAPVDHKYNCRDGSSNPTGLPATYPNFPTATGIGIPICTLGKSPYIDGLRAQLGDETRGSPSILFLKWTDFYSCDIAADTTATAGNWWINCPEPGGLVVRPGKRLSIPAGNVVSQGGIDVKGILQINNLNPLPSLPVVCAAPAGYPPCITSSASTASFLYMRDGDLNVDGSIVFNHVMVYQDDGVIDMSSGATPTWYAPTTGPLKNLAYWSEKSSSAYKINGGAALELAGTFFTPFARPLTLNGTGDWGQQNAQFITFQLSVTGNGDLRMSPDPNNLTYVASRRGLLIR